VVVRFILTGPLGTSCGQSSTVMFATPPFTLQPGTVKRLSFPVRVPATACPGTYSISATTLTGAVTVDTTSASLTVTRR